MALIAGRDGMGRRRLVDWAMLMIGSAMLAGSVAMTLANATHGLAERPATAEQTSVSQAG